MTNDKNTRYMGDGVYVHWNGHTMEVAVNDHRNEPVVYFEGSVMDSFMKFYQEMKGTKTKEDV